MNGKLDVMCDLETLSLDSHAQILSIALVPFGPMGEGLAPYYEKIAPLTSTVFTVDSSTIAWWDKQDHAVRDEAFGGTKTIGQVLVEVQNYLVAAGPIDFWSWGANFDEPILAHAFKVLGLTQPWSYKDVRCARTLSALHPNIKVPRIGSAHNALDDARNQAAVIDLCLATHYSNNNN